MKKVVIISRKSGQTNAFQVALDLRKEDGKLNYDVTMVLHPDLAPIDEIKPDFIILGPETIVWQAAIIKFVEERKIPYAIAKGSDFATRQVEKILALVK